MILILVFSFVYPFVVFVYSIHPLQFNLNVIQLLLQLHIYFIQMLDFLLIWTYLLSVYFIAWLIRIIWKYRTDVFSFYKGLSRNIYLYYWDFLISYFDFLNFALSRLFILIFVVIIFMLIFLVQLFIEIL